MNVRVNVGRFKER
jgi:hypothetical protein